MSDAADDYRIHGRYGWVLDEANAGWIPESAREQERVYQERAAHALAAAEAERQAAVDQLRFLGRTTRTEAETTTDVLAESYRRQESRDRYEAAKAAVPVAGETAAELPPLPPVVPPKEAAKWRRKARVAKVLSAARPSRAAARSVESTPLPADALIRARRKLLLERLADERRSDDLEPGREITRSTATPFRDQIEGN